MNEDAIRLMIREAIGRLQPAAPKPREGGPKPGEGGGSELVLAKHASHFRYALPGSGEACLIEPTVQCNHCGYCQSHGH